MGSFGDEYKLNDFQPPRLVIGETSGWGFVRDFPIQIRKFPRRGVYYCLRFDHQS